LSDKHLTELDQKKTAARYPAHQVIFHEGNQPFGIHCVTSGKVKVYKVDSEGRQQILRIAGPGDILGYRCLLLDEFYSVSAETIEEATVCFFDKQTFLHTLETHPQTALNVMKALSEDLGEVEQRVTDLVQKSVRERLIDLLLKLKARYGSATPQGFLLNIELSREEMAEMIGTTSESVIRQLSDLREEKLIQVDGRKITLRQVEKMALEAGLVD